MQSSDQILTPRKNRLRLTLGAAVALLVLGLAVAVLVSALGSHGATRTVTAPTPTASGTAARAGADATATSAPIYVHILGAVAKPGLFVLKDGDRAVDAVAAAGGFTAQADQGQLNLARLLVDGEQIYVPVVGEAPLGAPGGGVGGPGAAGGAGGTAGAVGAKVNLNTADEATLETLPRVGPAMAQRIIDWRTTNGRFSSVEDLMSVTGVGDKTFADLKDLVTV